MAISDEILPPHAGPAERALVAGAIAGFDFQILIKAIWNAEAAPADFLPWLAWALSVDEWDAEWTDEAKRATIRDSVEVHRHKGTVASIRRVLANAGYGDAQIIERFTDVFHDGVIRRDGTRMHGAMDHWAEYRIILSRPMTIAQANKVRAILAVTAPARCRLKVLDYQAAAHLHNGQIRRDGSYTHGAV